jgi:pyruvate-ferredoxin/flavodoxin oxidoreductase
MAKGMDQQDLAVAAGHWLLYRYNPALKREGKDPLQLDSKAPHIPLKDYIYNETRYRMLAQSNPETAAELLQRAQDAVNERWHRYEQLAKSQQRDGEKKL